MPVNENKKIYFLSDFHLGSPNPASSLQREKQIVRFLDEIKNEAVAVFIIGDMFDFWYEYKTVVPKGFVRIMGKLAELSDNGIALHFFVGNHDMWMTDYLQKELNMNVYFEPKSFVFNNKKIYIGHGDGLGPGDKGYKFLKKIFRNKFCQWLFGILPPYIGIGLANYFSSKSRDTDNATITATFHGEEKEWLILYCKEILEKEYFDYFIFGHRHLPIDYKFENNSRYINTGDWINYNSYAVLDGNELSLLYYNK